MNQKENPRERKRITSDHTKHWNWVNMLIGRRNDDIDGKLKHKIWNKRKIQEKSCAEGRREKRKVCTCSSADGDEHCKTKVLGIYIFRPSVGRRPVAHQPFPFPLQIQRLRLGIVTCSVKASSDFTATRLIEMLFGFISFSKINFLNIIKNFEKHYKNSLNFLIFKNILKYILKILIFFYS